MLKKNSLTDVLLRKGGVHIDDVQTIVKSRSFVNSTDLTGKILLLPSGRTISVVESTGRGTWICMYDAPPVKSSEMIRMTKQDAYDSRRIEFKHEFLIKYGEELEWIQES